MATLLLRLSWVFLKIGTFCFGGGIVIVPMVEHDVVVRYGWLTKAEFIDAIALSQVTPGPVVISATFIGYKVCGIPGAIVATASVILPSFVMICLCAKAIRKFRQNTTLAAFLRGASIAVIGMIFSACISIGQGSLVDAKTVLVAAASVFCLLKYKANPVWVLLGAGLIGLLI